MKYKLKNKYKLKDDVDFNDVTREVLIKYDINLDIYYDKKTRIFNSPKGYLTSHLLGVILEDFLIPLNLVEKLEE